MIHRHLYHQEMSLAAIDDVIARGKRQDWEDQCRRKGTGFNAKTQGRKGTKGRGCVRMAYVVLIADLA